MEEVKNTAEGASNLEVGAQVMGILNPTLQENDFLLSFVRVGLQETENHKGAGRKERKDGKREARRSPLTGHATTNTLPELQDGDESRQRKSDKKRKRRGGRKLPAGALYKEMNAQKSRKKKRRKNGSVRRQEEVYTDKDRAAAVNMGSRDIKQSLNMKRRQDRSQALQIPEEAEPGAMLALAAREMRSGDVEIALNFVNKALELSPADKNALIARSKCYLLLGQPQKALEDAEAALQEHSRDPSNARAMYYKAEALYHLGDFELSLVYYYRGMRIRSEFDGFRLGVQKAQEAIQNIIGDKSPPIPVALLSNKKTTPGTTTPQDEVEPVETQCDIPEPKNTPKKIAAKKQPPQRRKRSTTPDNQKTNVSHQRLLGQLEVDKKYLQNLLKHPDIKAPHQASAQHIAAYAEEGIAFLKSRQEFWRQQRATSSL